MTNPTAPPKYLAAEAREPRRSVVDDYELERRHEAVLRTALVALDCLRQAQAEHSEDGLTIVDRYGGVTSHPCVVIERDSRTAFLCAKDRTMTRARRRQAHRTRLPLSIRGNVGPSSTATSARAGP